jgi:fibronectin-binding autotransporter adhesin
MHRSISRSVSSSVSSALRIPGRRNRRRVVKGVALLASASAAAAFNVTAGASVFTYNANVGTTTDVWSAGTDWSSSPSAPTSAATTELTFAPTGGTFSDGITTTTTDDITGNFSLNILDLNGTGPVTTPSIVNINSAAAGDILNFISNGATTPVVNLNATVGAGLTYNINAPVNFTNSTNFTGNGTATFNLIGKTTAAASTTVQKTGTSTLTINPGANTDTFITLQGNGGTLNLAGGTINTTSLQMAPGSGVAAVVNMTGGIVTATSDFRVQSNGAGSTAFNVSGGTLNLSKVTIGSANGGSAASNVVTVSGNAAVIQNQTVGSRELWIGGNNSTSGTLQLQNSSSWTAGTTSAQDAVVGRFGGTGILTIQDSATFTYTGTNLDVADRASGGGATTGTINLNGGTLAVLGLQQDTGGSGSNLSTATFNANGGVVKALGNNTNFFNGFATATNKAGAVNLLAGGLNFNTNTFANTVTNVLTGAGGLTKQGSGTLTLSGNSTYTGNTSVSGGTLLVNGNQTASSGSPTISVSSGAILGGIGTIAGSFDHTAGTLSAATVGTIGTLTFSGPLTLDGGATTYDVNGANVSTSGNNSTAGDQIQVNNSLTFGASPETINFSFTNPGSLPAGSFTYKLFGYTGTLSGTPNLTYTSNLGRSMFTTSTATTGEVDAIVTPVAATLNWNSTSSGVWDVQTTANWYNTGTAASDVFFNGDSVNFVDNNAHSSPANGQLQTAITLNTTVTPGSVADSANSNAYTISGTGSIAGSASLNVTGTAPLTLTNSNTYTGGTTIGSGATIQLGDGTVATGTLGSGAVVDNGTLIANYGGSGTVVLGNAISGNGGLTKNGSSTLSITAVDTYIGNTTVNNGTLELDGTGALSGNGGSTTINTAIVATGTNTLGGNLSGSGTLTTTGTATLILTGTNSAFAGTTTVNTGTTLQIGANGTKGTLPGGTLAVTGTLAFDRSDNITLASPLNITAGTVSHIGTGNVTLTGSNSILTLSIGTNVPAGTVIVPSGASLTVGSAGTGALNIASSPNNGNSALSAGTLDVSQAASFSANVATVSVGLAGNHAVTGNTDTASGNLYLPANSTITATTSFVVGDSAGARNGDTGTIPNNSSNLTIVGGGTTTVNTPIFTIGGTKSTASFTLGAGGTFNLSGIGTGGRTFMAVGNIVTGGGAGTYQDNADLSAGVANLVLSGLNVGENSNNSGSGSAQVVATLHIGSSALNHLDISGPATGPVGNAGVINIGGQASNTTVQQSGTLTIDNLDSTSSITATDNGTAILVGGAQTAGNSLGTLNLNGGTLTFNTAGSAIASDTNAVPGFSTSGTSIVNFNGMKLIAGANSSTWIQNLVLADGVSSGANILAGGLPIDTNGHNITIPQNFVSGGGTDGGLTKFGTGSLTLAAAGGSGYTGNTTVNAGTLVVTNTSGSGTGSGNVIMNGGTLANGTAGGSVSGNVLAGTASHTIAPGGVGAIGSFSIGGLTSTNLTTLNFDLGSGAGPVITNGDLLTLGSGTVSVGAGTAITIGGTPVAGDDYRIIGGNIGGINPANFTLPTLGGFAFSLDTSVDPGFIDLDVIAAGPANLTWVPQVSSNAWDTTTNNFNNGTGPVAFSSVNADNVTFNDANNGNSNPNPYNVVLSGTITPTSVIVNTTGTYTFGGAGIGGASTLSKSNTGTLVLNNANTYSGNTSVTGGTLEVGPSGSLPSGNNLTIDATSMAATVKIDARSTTGIVPVMLGNLNLVAGGTLTVASPASAGSIANHPNRMQLVLTGTLGNAGNIDLGGNDMIIQNANTSAATATLTAVTAQLASGFSSAGYWAGTANGSIRSSAAAGDATFLTTLGVATGLTSFDGATIPATDVDVKYTYYGDANLDGTVDGSDYSLIDGHNGLTSGGTWQTGDFNYDGKVDGSDYSLIDNAFNQQGSGGLATAMNDVATNTSEIASGSAAVPEPASLGLLGIGALGLMNRRRRRGCE